MTTGLSCSTALGALTINSVSMHTPAWSVLDLTPLWMPVTTYRGENVVIPGASGRRAQPYRFDEGRYTLPFTVIGAVNLSGVAYSNPWVGLQTNLSYLFSNVFTPPAAPTTTQP